MGPCTANARRPTVDSRFRGTTISCCVADLRRCLPTTSVTGVQQSTRYCGALPCRHLCRISFVPFRRSVNYKRSIGGYSTPRKSQCYLLKGVSLYTYCLLVYIVCFATYPFSSLFLYLSPPYLSFPLRIDPLRFQAVCRKT